MQWQFFLYYVASGSTLIRVHDSTYSSLPSPLTWYHGKQLLFLKFIRLKILSVNCYLLPIFNY
jgi:hypothetical protein